MSITVIKLGKKRQKIHLSDGRVLKAHPEETPRTCNGCLLDAGNRDNQPCRAVIYTLKDYPGASCSAQRVIWKIHKVKDGA